MSVHLYHLSSKRACVLMSPVTFRLLGSEVKMLVTSLSPELIYPAQAGFLAFWGLFEDEAHPHLLCECQKQICARLTSPIWRIRNP